MSLSTRQRKPPPQPSTPSSTSYSRLDKSERKGFDDEGNKKELKWWIPFMALSVLRYMSATTNIIHDCDEVFNYWEPLHYLVYKSGFQTWEYSSQFALRSYLYIIFHELVARPTSWIFGDEKVRVFYAVRLFLGFLSVITETILVVALARKYGRRLATYTLAMLCLTSGCFFASTSLLPSSFSMYAVTLSSALFLLEKHAMAVSVAALGVILGWPFSVFTVVPLTYYCLKKNFKQVFVYAAATSLIVFTLSVLADYYYYKRWTSSVLNLLIYNVMGGGESHLYGTEGPLFYLRNGFNNFNFSFVLALLFPGILPITKRKYFPNLLVVVLPIYMWVTFMSLLPHKEERFLYPIYPLICVSASAVIESFPDLFRDKYVAPDHKSVSVMVAKLLRPVFLAIILCVSHSRTFSIINGYSAPLEIYKHLEHHEDAENSSVVCVGSEWHRFPSSFFIPDYVSDVRWIDDGYRGLLPLPFNSTLGGTAGAPHYFNNKNKASDAQYLKDIGVCDFLVELQLQRPYHSRGSDSSTWEVVAAFPYIDRELSPSLYRSFFIPYLWFEKNTFGMYKLLRRVTK